MRKLLLKTLTSTLIALLLSVGWSYGQQTLIISEVADPGDVYQARFVELYNATSSSIDLTGWQIRRYANDNTTSGDIDLSGSIAPGETYVVASSESDFQTQYGFAPDLSSGTISGNGDDTYELFDGSAVVDIYGEVGVDGTGEAWEYENSHGVRNASIGAGNTTWTGSEWTITAADVADMTPGTHTCDYPGGSDAPVATFNPADGAANHNINDDIIISFDEPIYQASDGSTFDDATIDNAITTFEVSGGSAVSFDATINAEYTEITVTPDAPLTDATTYDLTLGAVEDAAGNETTAQSISFTTTNISFDITAPTASSVFYAGDNTTITWTSQNNSGNVNIYVYDPVEDGYFPILTDIADDGTETYTIPTDAYYGDTYHLYISTVSDTTIGAYSEEFTIKGVATISEIQQGIAGVTSHDYTDDIIKTTGTVFFIDGSNYYLMDGTGAWNSINVYDGANAGSLTIGDNITVEATAGEYNDITQISDVTILSTNATGQPVNETVATTGVIDESYESVLVKIINTEVTDQDLGFGEFEIDDGSGALAVDDYFYYHDAVLADDITITGIGYYSYGAYKILPRDENDVVSATDTLGSAIYDVDQSGMTISNVPYSADLATFESNITPADTATWDVYDADGTTPATTLDATKLAKVVAADGITTAAYTISINAASTDPTVTSGVYTVDDGASTISDIPIGTLRSEFESNITPADGATYEIYETDGTTIVGASDEIMDNYELEVTAEDGTTTKTYVLAIVDYDTDSYVAAPATQVPAATVSSLADTEAEAFEAFSIDIHDAGTNDGQPTEVLTLTFNAGPSNTADFANDIDGGYLEVDGTALTMDGEPTVTATQVSINLAAGELVIPDGESKTVTGYLWLNTSVADGTVIQWMVNQSGHGFVASTSGSTFASDFGAAVTGNEISVEVSPTALAIHVEPTDVLVGDYISPAVEVAAVDANGNIDQDYVSNISISANGATLDGEPVIEAAVDGIASFTTLSFSAEATGVTLEATSGLLSAATSASFDVIKADLYFSEYIEGSSYNKAIEIYNPTSNEVDLTPYVVKLGSNGGDWGTTLDLAGTIGAHEVYIIANSQANSEILDIADITSDVTSYNGDDAIGLFNDGTMIDAIGTYQEDPGESWDVAGVTGATEEHTLIRKDGIFAGNTNWPESAGNNAEDSEWLVYGQDYFANLGKRSLGTEAEILEFTFVEAYGETTIDEGAATVTLEVVNGTDLTSLEPIMELSPGATSVPEAGTAQNFSSDVTYTVTAEDENTTKEWTVTVTEAAGLSPNAEIRELSVEGMDSVQIDSDGATVDVFVPFGYDVTSVKPSVLLSGGVQSIAPDTSIAQDFSTAVVYTVTAQDGTTKDWAVSLIPFTPPVKSIYDIQYTELASGDSPEKGNTVEVRGIVTGTVTGSGAGYFLQDGEGAWNGIWVLDNENTPAIGDSVEVIGTVDEYWDLTEIKSVAEFTVAASDKDLPAPTTLTALAAAEEQYESVFITIEKATTTNVDAGNGMWEVEDATGTLLVDDVIFAFTPEDDAIYTITGIAYYSYEERKILPRSAADIVQDAAPVIGTITLNPTAPEADQDVVVSTEITDDEEVTAAALYWGTSADAITNNVSFTQPGFDDTYEGTIPGQDAGTTVHYKVEAEDGYSKTVTTASYTVASGTGIIENGSISVKAYPNPTNGRFKLELTGAEEMTVEVYNLVGKVIYTEVVKNADNSVTDINLESEAQGIYYIRVTDGEIVNTLKLLVK